MRIWRSQRTIVSLTKETNPIFFPSNLSCLLQRCSDSRSLDQGKQVHQRIVTNGSGQEPYIITKLIRLYSDCDDFSSAQNLFDRLPQPNVFAWTSVLAFYSRHGLHKECLGNYSEMKINGVSPDNYIFPKALRACAQLLCLEVGIQVHRDVIAFGFEPYLQVCNSLIDMYAKCGEISSAWRVFDEMGERDILSWNSMISGYVCNGLPELAVNLFGYLRGDNTEPDTVSYNAVIDAYCRMGLCDEARKIFEQLKEPNIISWTTLISGYSRTGNHEISLRVFQEMMTKGKVLPDLDSLSSSLVSCRHLGALISGKEIHAYGIKTIRGTKFYGSTGAALLTIYAKCVRIRDARNMFELMDKSDVVTWNAMVLGFVDLGLEQMALECFTQLQGTGIKINQITISTILPVCDMKSGKQFHTHITKLGFLSDITVCNALIHMYSKSGSIQSASLIFANMVVRDLVTWNSIIGGFAINGLGQESLRLLLEMNKSGFLPDSTTFTSVLSACSHSGLVGDGIKLLNSISRDFGLVPRMEHFACVIDMLARAGRLEDAVGFTNTMPFEPDKRIWGSILAACKEQQNLDVGKLAAEKLIQLEPECSGHYVALSNIYARAGKWIDAVEIRRQLEGRGLNKPLGQSWIECGN